MMKYVRKKYHPTITVKRIQSILKELGFDIIIKSENIVADCLYSIRLEFSEFPGLGTNGKGITRAWALASAYAEFMERLQGGMLLPTKYMLKNEIMFGRQETTLPLNKLEDILVDLFLFKESTLVKSMVELCKANKQFLNVTPVEELTTAKMLFLPMKIIDLFTHSNGLCAGNSKKEALTQGICEIMERYCLRCLYKSKRSVATIVFENALTNKLREMEYQCYVKDCSLGKFPVVGVLILNKDSSKYVFVAGADPNFDIAVQRCLTEAFQGYDLNNIEEKMKSISLCPTEYTNQELEVNYLKQFQSNDGILLQQFFLNDVVVSKPECFIESFDEVECYEYVLDILRKEGLTIYCADYSFLGFPTFKIYIPTMSEIEAISEQEIICMKDSMKIKKLIFSLENATDTEVANVLNKLSPLLQLGKYHIIRPAALFSLPYFVQSDLDKLSFAGFLFFLAMHANEISRAEKICKEEIASSYCTIQEKKIYDKILRHSSTLERFILRNRYTLKLPACPECYRCKCKDSCKYEKWKIYATNLLLACEK